MARRSPLLTALALLVLPASALGAQPYYEDWDAFDDVAGWVMNTIAVTISHSNVGGNPNGYLVSTREGSGVFSAGATSELPAVSGDYAAAGITEVSFDVLYSPEQPGANLQGGGPAYFAAAFRVRYQGPANNGWTFGLPNDFTPGWKSYTITFDPTWTDMEAVAAGWVPDDPMGDSFATTMSDVYHPEVRIDGNGTLVVGIDNFRLSAGACDEDVTGPTVDVTLSRDTLWPPNHKMIEVCAEVTAEDNCDSDVDVDLVSVTSSEPENGLGDGDTEGDIEILENGCFLLRSERAGGGDGRKYSIVYSATDNAGNTTYDTTCVMVPHSRNGHAHVASGIAGGGFQAGASQYALTVLSRPGFDARQLDPSRAFVGNDVGYVRPVESGITDVNGDHLTDRVFLFDTSDTQDLIDASVARVEAEAGATYQVGDGELELARPRPTPAAFYYEGPDGASFLETNVLRIPGVQQAPTPKFEEAPDFELAGNVVRFAVPEPSRISITLFNVLGQKVRTLVAEDLSAGVHEVAWDGTDDSGSLAPAGIYFARMSRPTGVSTARMLLSR
ncbi:MAG TPA: FlgD immunoglobulin-like domain containing protein [Candidatus Eisenbacteria bacterium]